MWMDSCCSADGDDSDKMTNMQGYRWFICNRFVHSCTAAEKQRLLTWETAHHEPLYRAFRAGIIVGYKPATNIF